MSSANALRRASTDAEVVEAPSIFLVAGEASGDEHAARVVESIKEANPRAKIFGMGGSKLRCAGMDIVIDSEHTASVMGVTEVFSKLGELLKARATLLTEIDRRKPTLAILVDFPDFNFTLLRRLKKRRIKVLYYISPQLWAWRQGRINSIKKYVTKVVPIFPFEEKFYQKHGIDAEFFGHPFLDRKGLNFAREDFIREIGLDSARPIVALLPGSRRSELDLLLAPMIEALQRLRLARPGLQAILPVADTLERSVVASMIPPECDVAVIQGGSREVLLAADVAVVASGTATVEAALCEIPFVAIYKLAPLTHKIAKVMIRGVTSFAMANLIAGKQVVQELLQDQASAARIAQELEKILGDSSYRKKMKKDLQSVRRRLATPHRRSNETSARQIARMVLEIAGVRNER